MHRLFALTLALLAPAALAHDEHCHTRLPDGSLSDLAGFTTAKSCRQNGGFWVGHGEHCHVKSGEGAIPDDDDTANTAEKCARKGGSWVNHGHKPR